MNTLEHKGFYVLKWARRLPNWGTLLAHHGQRACPGWADLLSDVCPISSYCNTNIPVFRILPTHAIPAVWITHSWHSFHLTIPHFWRFLTLDNSFHQQTIQTIGWQSPDSQLSVCQNVTMKNQTIWQFRLFLGYMTFFFILFPLWLIRLLSFLSQML